MRLLINTASAMRGGSTQVTYSFIKECAKIEDHEYDLIAGEKVVEALGLRLFFY